MMNLGDDHDVKTCRTCGRVLPRRAYKLDCASCIKASQGKPRGEGIWQFAPAERAELIQAANAHRASIGLPLLGRRARREQARVRVERVA